MPTRPAIASRRPKAQNAVQPAPMGQSPRQTNAAVQLDILGIRNILPAQPIRTEPQVKVLLNLLLSESELARDAGASGATPAWEHTTPLRSHSCARRLRRRPAAELGARHATPTVPGDDVIGLPFTDQKRPRASGIQGDCTTRPNFAQICGRQSAPPVPAWSTAAQPASEHVPPRMGCLCSQNGHRLRPRTPAHSPTDAVRSPDHPVVSDHPKPDPAIRPQEPPTK